MKRQYLKFFISVLFLQANTSLVFAQINLGNSQQQVQAGISADEHCVQTPRPENLEQSEYWYDQAYHNCISRNNTRAQQRAMVQRGQQDAQDVLNGNLKEPTNNCKQNTSSGEYDYAYGTCMQQYSNEKREYDRKVDAANRAKAAEEKAAAQPVDQSIAQNKDTTATGSMAEIQKKSEDGNMLYKVAGIALAGYAAKEFIQAQSCASQCSMMGGGCCAMAPGLAAAGAAFMLLNGKANKQADELVDAGQAACQNFNKQSSAQKDCTGAGGTTTQNIPPVTEWYDNEGKCKATAPPECKNIAGTGSGSTTAKIPSNCKDASGKPISCVTAGMGAFKQNPDGSIKVKTPNGYKTYTLADFADKKSMMAAGLTAAQADALMDQLYGKNSILAKAGLEAKELAKEGKKFSDFANVGSGTNVVNLDAAKNASKKFGEKLDSSLDGRRPSSEGLTREFNGDLIGAAGDDIFTMMKRRYNLKAEQDTFISP